MPELSFRPAITTEAKPIVGLYARSGAGKTFSSLLLAKGFAGDMGKVGMIETEAGRGEVFADDPIVGGYRVCPIRDSFEVAKYSDALTVAEHAGLRALIIDSASHWWEGVGGVLEQAGNNQAAGKKGQLAWQRPKLDHKRFILRLMQTPIDLVIVCMRARYPMVEVAKPGGGKDWTRSTELEPNQGDDILSELMVHGWIDEEHRFHVTKTTTDAMKAIFLDGKPITVETGQRLAAWAAGRGVQSAAGQRISAADARGLAAVAKTAGHRVDSLRGWLKYEYDVDSFAAILLQDVAAIGRRLADPVALVWGSGAGVLLIPDDNTQVDPGPPPDGLDSKEE